MPPSADVIRADFQLGQRPAEAMPRDRLEPAVERLVGEVALRRRVLDIGCGTGALARELVTRRGAKVTAIDLSPRMIDVARVRTRDSLGIEYRVADLMELSPHGFDVAIAAFALERLPLQEAAEIMAASVVPGGLVLIAGRYRVHPGLAWLVRGEVHADTLPLGETRSTLRLALPGVAVRRHLGGRYTAIWRKP